VWEEVFGRWCEEVLGHYVPEGMENKEVGMASQ